MASIHRGLNQMGSIPHGLSPPGLNPPGLNPPVTDTEVSKDWQLIAGGNEFEFSSPRLWGGMRGLYCGDNIDPVFAIADQGERKMTNSPLHFWLAHSRWFRIKHSHVRRETGRGEDLFDPGKKWVRQKSTFE